jgi:acetolactate synthase-1/2/3 large subunit
VCAADLVFFIGSHTGSQVTNAWQVPRPGTAVVQLDIDPQELGRNYPNTVSLCGDARATLRQLLAVVEAGAPDLHWLQRVADQVNEWRSQVEPLRSSNAVPLRPERICKEIEAVLPADAILVSDTGHAGIWSGAHIELHHPTQAYIRAAGSLGWGLPAALGAKCAAPDRPVICFTGDGGFYYHMAELETAVRYGIAAVIVVNDNHALSQETEVFAQAYGGEQRGGLEMWQFRDVDLATVARALGCFGERVERAEQIRPALDRALACGRPAVLDVVSDVKALAPAPWAPTR